MVFGVFLVKESAHHPKQDLKNQREKVATLPGKPRNPPKVTHQATPTKNEPEAKQKTNSQHEVRQRFSCFLSIVEIGR